MAKIRSKQQAINKQYVLDIIKKMKAKENTKGGLSSTDKAVLDTLYQRLL